MAREQSFAFKIAHDERFAKYSPGVLLERFNVKRFAEAPAKLDCMDSCAHEGHPMIERLWPDRREIAELTIAGRGLMPRAFVALRARLRARSRNLRRAGAGLLLAGGYGLTLNCMESMPVAL